MIQQIRATQGGKGGIVGFEKILIEGVHVAPQGEGLSHPGISGEKQDAAPAFDIIEPSHGFLEGLRLEDILGLEILIKRKPFEPKPSRAGLSWQDLPFVKGQMGRDLLGPEGAGIFLFVEQLDPAHPNAVVIEVELFGVIDGVADLDALTDIGGGDLIESALEADGGIVIDDPFVADEEDLIELGPGEPSDQHPAHGGVIAVDGSFLDAGVEFMVVVVLEPESRRLR